MGTATGFVVCTTVIILFTVVQRLGRRSNLPKGPRGIWIIGNLSDFVSEYRWKKFSAWSKIFGDVVHMTVLGQSVVVLNKFEDARELMDRRGALYSDRPRMVYIAEVLNIRSPTFMHYGNEWRAYRRVMQQYLNPRAIVAFRPLQTKCVRSLLEDILCEQTDFWKHVKRFVASVVLSATYGHTIAREDDRLFRLFTHSERAFVRFGPPGATVVDFFPFFRHILQIIPGTSLKKITSEARNEFREMATLPYQMVEKQREAGTAVPSLLSCMLDDYETKGIADEASCEVIKNVCGAMYRAGVGTTSAALYIFILAMVLHPQAAIKAQKELDAVLDGGRLPSFEDQDSLPYIGCIMKECLRWAPPFPLGIAHRSMGEGELEGKRIPKGSMIMPNIWQMMHDERNYDQPETFNPDRFMKSDDGASAILEPANAVFGFGRRICPGRHFAEATLWFTIASILTVFEILPAIDENGSEVLPEVQFIPRLNSWTLKEFACQFVPRSENAEALVKMAR